jgi:hypothetical protein
LSSFGHSTFLSVAHAGSEKAKTNASVMDFLHADYAVVNERLARHYGLPAVYGSDYRRVPLNPADRRGGVLTQAGLLAMNSDGKHSHPLKRGIWMLERILNDPPPPPPPAIPEIDLADPKIAKMSLKERIENHRSHVACAPCHAKIDPWGIALENFDAVGSWRDKINGVPVDAVSLLFNKQKLDGIDGLAGMQAIFMLLAGAMLLVLLRPEVVADPLIIWMLCVAGGTAGFMLLNWPPAKIFMGDVGSVYLAFMLLSFGLLSIRTVMVSVPMGLSMWAILGATFATDATITLITRILTSEKWHLAHSSHLYQRLSRKLGSHRPVTLIYLAVNLFWLLPLAYLCTRNPQWSVALAVVAYLPLIAVAIRYGAGRPDA